MEYQKSGMPVARPSIAAINRCGCNNRKTIFLPNGRSENERIQNYFGQYRLFMDGHYLRGDSWML